MATKHDVIRLHREHPDWCDQQIANELGCLDAYIRATARRYGLRLPSRPRQPRPPNSILALGRQCKALGLTLDDLDRMAAGARNG